MITKEKYLLQSIIDFSSALLCIISYNAQETSGKEDHLMSPYLDEEFEKAKEMGGPYGKKMQM